MNDHKQVREFVSEAYAKAVSTRAASPCCGPVQKGVVVQLAGYTPEELNALPQDAVVNSFGCGNPLAFGEVREGDVVLDLGSGAGIDVLLAAKKVGPTGRAIGIDMTDDMLEKARENIAASGMANVEVRKGIIENLPVDAASVDLVISNCVINLSPEKSKVFAEIARVLKPGGRMLISDIVVKELPEWARTDKSLYSSCIAGAISEEDYIDGIRRAGLTNIEVRERIVYDTVQLRSFIESELNDYAATSSCCGGDGEADARGDVVSLSTTGDLADSMVSKVWSAKFFASKPNESCGCA